MNSLISNKFFVDNLLKWNRLSNNRLMPWKGEKNPYKIWLSEIILQQTRVNQGMEYYLRFVNKFPDVHALANASENQVFKLWEGLGYYTRCKNLIASAKYISQNLNGKFPETYVDLLALKGVGPYTAAAIGSFAFNLPVAVVDGNVYRVLSRYFGMKNPVDSTEGKEIFAELANKLIDKKNPSIYNQALMDFGATICKPQLPVCVSCLLKKNCTAFTTNTVDQFPVKEKSIQIKNRWFYYLLIEFDGKWYVRKRKPKDIWENLYEFVLMEEDNSLTEKKIVANIKAKYFNNKETFVIKDISKVNKQKLTHQTIQGQFITIQLKKKSAIKGFQLASPAALKQLPFPKFIANYLKDKSVSLNLGNA